MRFTIAAFAFAATVLTSGFAAAEAVEPPITNPQQIISDVTDVSMTALLTELGAQRIETKDLGEGKKQIVFYDGATPYNVMLLGCDVRPGKCIAFAMVALLETENNAYSLDAINSVNKSNAYVTLVKVDATKIGGGRIEIVDGGVTKKNLAIQIGSFVGNFAESLKALQGQLVAGNQPGAGYQYAGYGARRFRQIPATPQQMRTIANGLAKGYVPRFRRY